jgi:hypothetical protein
MKFQRAEMDILVVAEKVTMLGFVPFPPCMLFLSSAAIIERITGGGRPNLEAS